MEYFDSHCHLNDEAILSNIEEEYRLCLEAGVTHMLCVGYDVASSKVAVDLAERFPAVYAAVGVHPENLEPDMNKALQEIKELAKHPKVLAIGEIGLDYYWYKDPEIRNAQKPWFIAQIALAEELGLPISIHARDAVADTLEILKEHTPAHGGVLHCYSGSPESLKEFAKLGLYFGFDGPITFKNAVTPKECVRVCPLDRLLVETDSPYLAPTPFRGKQNSPKYIPFIVDEMAKIKEMEPAKLNEALWENFSRLFRVKHG
ncbi:MAG: TatD family hydrolase [Bacilli bacterium]|nr:TatD family hydrolase [Bacilli bacterium]